MTYSELSEAQARRSRQFAEAQTNTMSVYCDAERDLKELQTENAKLRELATRAWRLFTENGAVHPSDLSEVDAVRDGLRELGIEVDG